MKKKRKGLKIAVITIVVLIAAGLGALGYYLYEQANSGLFFEDTVINGYDVSGKTCKEVLLMLEKEYSAPKVEIREKGESALKLTFEEMGYTIDQMELLSNIQNCMHEQNLGLLFSLMEGNTFEIDVPFRFDEDVFSKAVSAANFSSPRVSSQDATLEYNGTEYYIEPEIYGNELDDADLQVMVRDYVDKMVDADRPQPDGEIDVPESFYFIPAVTQDDSEMNTLMNLYNSYCKAKITLTFGRKSEVIDWDTIQDWLIIEDGTAVVDEEDVYNYVYELAAKYDTLYHQREFTTHAGNVITYESSDYGYQIDKDAEASQLISDINSNTEVEREPVYAVKGYKRNGRDDIAGNYVEVDLTQQHVWFYKDGKLIVETDCVSGLPKDGRETVTGVFSIPYKKSPEVLKGDTWEQKVTYWMPFYDGQGLHDAPWRTSFGGNIYQTNGSHGCVNLPADAAKTIYDNMEERMAIFLYK
ncbi:MAG: L,D-transpeptidase family protein [Candidatus Choladocola sp.]|nr:L,D-transpeptidase family protein [Candidatus Choladocola sp.]